MKQLKAKSPSLARHHSNDSAKVTLHAELKRKKLDEPEQDKNKKLTLSEEVSKELAGVQAPEPTDLINMLQELEKSASSDAVVRKRIAELPTHLTDLGHLSQVRERSEAFSLLETVNEAASLLDDYNARLQQEMTNRRKTALQLAAFIRGQQTERVNDQKLIDEWQRILAQVKHVKHELRVHLENLPDLSSIEEAAELIPLPTPGDLFSSKASSTN